MAQVGGLLLKRSFCTGRGAAQLVKAPIQLFGVEGRYATALYSAASKAKNLDTVEKELKDIKTLFNDQVKFQNMVLDPSLKRQTKRVAMAAVLQKLGHCSTTVNFFDVVAENGRLVRFDKILRSFEEIMKAHRGEVSCEVVSAKALDAESTKQLNAALQAFTKQGEKLSIVTKVDPSLIGGIIVKIGDKFVDMSISSKVKNYEKLLQQAV